MPFEPPETLHIVLLPEAAAAASFWEFGQLAPVLEKNTPAHDTTRNRQHTRTNEAPQTTHKNQQFARDSKPRRTD